MQLAKHFAFRVFKPKNEGFTSIGSIVSSSTKLTNGLSRVGQNIPMLRDVPGDGDVSWLKRYNAMKLLLPVVLLTC